MGDHAEPAIEHNGVAGGENVSATVDFWFDFVSPYAYLMHQRLPDLCHRYGYQIDYKPIDMPKAKRAAGNTGPSNREIPSKFRYLRTDMQRWAELYGVPLQLPKSFDSARVNKGTFHALSRKQADRYSRLAWRMAWGEGGDLGSDEFLRDLAKAMGWNPDEFIEFTSSVEAQALYDVNGAEAVTRGIFGVPIVTIGEHMWWGNDRLDFLERHLKASPGEVQGVHKESRR